METFSPRLDHRGRSDRKKETVDWLQSLFGAKPKTIEAVHKPQWTSHRGDEWWCDDASAGYSFGNFTIGTFGKHARPSHAYDLIKDAREGFPDATIDVYLDKETSSIVKALVERGLIEIVEIALSPKTRVARIETLK
jgi:hypothetical protein